MEKSLRDHPVEKLYTLSYGFFSNKEFFCSIREYNVKFTEKNAKLKLNQNHGVQSSMHKSEDFFYDMDGINGYYSSPEIVLDRFKKAVEITKTERWKSRPPEKLECLDLMIASLEKQVDVLQDKKE